MVPQLDDVKADDFGRQVIGLLNSAAQVFFISVG
jgi:hypothetical protein